MEKYSANCKIILVCNALSKIMLPIRSRCLGVRVPLPSTEEVVNCLNEINTSEAAGIGADKIVEIAKITGNNTREAICSLHMSRCLNSVHRK